MSIIIDLLRKKSEHHVFNSQTIKALDELDESNFYYLSADSSSCDVIENKHNISSIKVSQSKLYLWVVSTLLLIKLIFSNRKLKTPFFILSATPLQYKVCALLSNILKVRLNIFMHGELGYTNAANGLGQKIGGFLIKYTFSQKSQVRFLAIDEYIYLKLKGKYKKALFFLAGFPLQEIPTIDNKNTDVLRIGSFGIQSRDKNSELIYEIASRIEGKKLDGFELFTIGVTNGSFKYDEHDNVQHLCRGDLKSDLIPKDVFFKEVFKLDFALFFNSYDQKYDLIPSGVFYDCIAMELPIIAIKNPKLEFFFKKYGDIGILCEDIEDMVFSMIMIKENKKLKAMYKKKIKEFKDGLSFKIYKEKLNSVLTLTSYE